MEAHRISTYFQEIHSDLVGYVDFLCKKYKRSHDKHSVVSECFIYLVERSKELKKKEDVKAFSIKFVKNSIVWKNSQLNRKGELRRGLTYSIEEIEEETPYKISKKLLEISNFENQDMKFKTEIEQRETNYKVLISHYKRDCNDPVKRRLLDVYTVEKVDTVRKMADFYGFSKDSAASEINGLIYDLKKFAKEKGYLSLI